MLPSDYVERLGIEAKEDVYEVQGFDGEPKRVSAIQLEIIFLGRKFSDQFLLINQPIGIL